MLKIVGSISKAHNYCKYAEVWRIKMINLLGESLEKNLFTNVEIKDLEDILDRVKERATWKEGDSGFIPGGWGDMFSATFLRFESGRCILIDHSQHDIVTDYQGICRWPESRGKGVSDVSKKEVR